MKRLLNILHSIKTFFVHIVRRSAFIDRNLNLIFNKQNCLQLYFKKDAFKHNDILTTTNNNIVRCLGKTWYVNVACSNFKNH